MRIMTILGSPRPAGNTAKVLKWIEQELAVLKHEVDRANVVDYRIDGCHECNACKQGNIDFCAVRDDAIELFGRMVRADVVVFASPVFCWGFPAQLKALIDRMYGLMNETCLGQAGIGPSIAGGRMALVLTAGGEIENNIDLVAKGFASVVEYLKARPAGELFYPFCEPAKLNDEAKQRAVAFARQLVTVQSVQ